MTALLPALLGRRPVRAALPPAALAAAIWVQELGVRLHAWPWQRPRWLLQDLGFAVQPGEVVAFLGHNGAGKTTLMRILMGLLRPHAGAAWLFGRPTHAAAARWRVGFLPERANFPRELTASEFVTAHARLAGLGRAAAGQAAADALAAAALADAAKRRLGHFSKGMLQRVGLAQALLQAPRLLVLDEPMSGLDPAGRQAVRRLLLAQKARGTAILFSTHVLEDAQAVCDRAVVLAGGRQIFCGTMAEYARQAQDPEQNQAMP